MDSRIDFVCADAYHVLASLTPGISGIPAPKSKSDEWPPRVDVILLAPPWGGPDYTQKKHFDMSTDFPSGCGLELVRKALLVCENVICVYPRNIKNSQVISLCESVNAKCYVDEVILYKKHKLSVLYFGRMFN